VRRVFYSMVKYSGVDKEESREFWGVNLPSLLANGGMLLNIGGFYFSLLNGKLSFLPFLGSLGIICGLYLNIRKGLSLKWRRINFFFHLFFLLISFFLDFLTTLS